MQVSRSIAATLLGIAIVLSGCSSRNSPPPGPSAVTYTVGGNVSGLSGSVTLTNNGADSRTITTSGAFTFVTAMPSGSAYAVAISAHPTGQTCSVTNGSGIVATSNIVNIAIDCAANSSSPGISSQPTDQSVVEPDAATFSITATGSPTPTYQWQESSDGTTFTDIAGATSATHNTGPTTISQSGSSFRVIVTNSAGSLTSNVATLTVSLPPTAPIIHSQPSAQVVNEPSAATFTVVASGDPSPSYQWQLSTDGATYTDIVGATASAYNTGATTTAQSGHSYRVIVTNSAGSMASDGVQLIVNAAVTGATIIFTRDNGTVNVSNHDLYAIRESGGGETVLADSASNENFCGVTSSGRVIYQIDVGGQIDIRSVNIDGTDTRVLADAPDNEFCSFIVPSGPAAGRLIYRRDSATSGRDVYAVNADGSSPTPLANGPLDEGFVGITGQNRVIFHRASSFDTDVYSVDLEGLSVIPLANSTSYEGFLGEANGLVVIGRDGFNQGDLYTVGEMGTGFGPLAADPNYDENLAGITPGGAFIVKARSLSTGVRTLYAGGIMLASDPDDVVYLGSTATHVAYSKYLSNQTDTYAVRIDGGGNVALADSPDSENVVFLTDDGRAFYEAYGITGSTVTLGDVYLINVDGSNRVPLAVSADHESFAALIGDRLLYRREIANSVNNIQLWSINVDGTGHTRVLNLGGQAHFAAATPSGKVIIRYYTGINHLYIANTDGTDARLLATGAFFNAIAP